MWEKSRLCSLHVDKIILPKLVIICFSFSQMPFSAIDKVCDFLYVPFSLSPLRDLFFPIFHVWEHFPSLWWNNFTFLPSFWSGLWKSLAATVHLQAEFFSFPQDMLFSNNPKAYYCISLCLLFSFFPKKVSSFFLSEFRGSNRGHWKSLIMIKNSDTVNTVLIKAHLSWKLLFHLIKPVCLGDTEDSSWPQ